MIYGHSILVDEIKQTFSLKSWLICKLQTSSYKKFHLFEVDEQQKIDEIKPYLQKLLLDARLDPQLLQAAAHRIGWKKTENLLIKASLPTKRRKRLGDFGEILKKLGLWS